MKPSDLIFIKTGIDECSDEYKSSLPITIEGDVYVWKDLSGTSNCNRYVNGKFVKEDTYGDMCEVLDKFTQHPNYKITPLTRVVFYVFKYSIKCIKLYVFNYFIKIYNITKKSFFYNTMKMKKEKKFTIICDGKILGTVFAESSKCALRKARRIHKSKKPCGWKHYGTYVKLQYVDYKNRSISKTVFTCEWKVMEYNSPFTTNRFSKNATRRRFRRCFKKDEYATEFTLRRNPADCKVRQRNGTMTFD